MNKIMPGLVYLMCGFTLIVLAIVPPPRPTDWLVGTMGVVYLVAGIVILERNVR